VLRPEAEEARGDRGAELGDDGGGETARASPAPVEPVSAASPRTPRTTPRAAPVTMSPIFSAPATPRTAPRRIVSRVFGEKTAAVAAATTADSVLIRSSIPTASSFGVRCAWRDLIKGYPCERAATPGGHRAGSDRDGGQAATPRPGRIAAPRLVAPGCAGPWAARGYSLALASSFPTPSFPTPMQTRAPKIALVHDFLLDLRGGERTFLQLCEMWPTADLFTAVYDEQGTEGRFARRGVKTSFLQRLHPTARTFRMLLPLYPAAIQSLDLGGYDLVISSSSAWAHGVRVPHGAVHVSYCHNPFRYAWNERDATLARRDPLSRLALGQVLERWRRWDVRNARRTDRYVVNARVTQQRVREYFHREAAIVHPPVDVARFAPGRVAGHYAIVSELMPHKQIDVAIEAFGRLHLPLLVVGDGPDLGRLRRLAGPTISFAGRLSDEAVAEVLGSARALVSTSVEEFGITVVEAQAAGRPVIARGQGGVLETVVPGVTGTFWNGGPEALAETVLRFDDGAIDPRACVANAARFSPAVFRAGIRREVRAALSARHGSEAHGPEALVA
jgi:glycosyltransferase involved in cell wall biosynthesis